MVINKQTFFSSIIVAALASVLWLPVASAEIYQWTDEHGRKHFSQTPPPSGQYSKKEVKTAPPSDPAAAQARLERLLEQRKAAQATQKEQRQKAQRQASENKQRQQACRTAREHLTGLELRPRVLLKNADGSVTRLTEEERQQRISQAKAQIKKICN